MITTERKNNNIKIDLCSELKDVHHRNSYLNYLTPEGGLKKFYFENIDLQVPEKIDSSDDTSIMTAEIGGKYIKKIRGQYHILISIYILVRQFQSGTLYCRYCRRTFPKGCQIFGFLNLLPKLKKSLIMVP